MSTTPALISVEEYLAMKRAYAATAAQSLHEVNGALKTENPVLAVPLNEILA